MSNTATNDSPFLFSFVMAVYNVESYLQDAVDSLVNQTIGFDKLQLILIDDGSDDGSGLLCDRFLQTYPVNITVIHKENGGVSSARNIGLALAKGEYVSFLDPDDKLTPNTCELVYNFFCSNRQYTDVVAIPMFFFEGQTGPHTLNYKFNKGTRVIDLNKEYENIQLSMASTFVKREALAGLSFNEAMPYAEDASMLQPILARKATLGVVSNARYCYRKRIGESQSAIQGCQSDYRWYTEYLELFQISTINYFLDALGYIPLFVQYTLMHDLQWKLRQQSIPEEVSSAVDINLYKKQIHFVLEHVDDAIILKQKFLWHEHKTWALINKHSSLPRLVERKEDAYLAFGSTVFYTLSNCQFTIEFINLTESECIISGYTIQYPIYNDDFAIYAKIDDSLFLCELVYKHEPHQVLDEQILNYYGFTCKIPLEEHRRRVSFYTQSHGILIQKRNICYKQYCPIGMEFANSYYADNGWVITRDKNSLVIEPTGLRGLIRHEFAFDKELWRRNTQGSRKAILPRIFTRIFRALPHKQIWLFSDKANRADDNGEALFTYVQTQTNAPIKSFFLIGKDSADYSRLSSIGNVLPYMSWKHKLAYLVADYTISAYSHNEINNPFYGYHAPYRDLLQKCKFVFLQHGVTKDDISSGINRSNKNLFGFVTAAQREYDSIIDTPNYGYSATQVWLTGFPRYDRLYHAEDNEIVIMPTWRRQLFGSYHSEDSRWDLKPGFTESDYFKFYSGLLNSRALLDAAKLYGYKVNFVPHPTFFPYIDSFNVPDQVNLWGTEVCYRDMFAKNKLLVTDYSSVAFDFAYLRKPVVYAHFDTNHYAEGYFEYERDGFGEVTYDLDSTVHCIIDYMKNGCLLKTKYRERINDFFKFNDTDNCRRVFAKLLAGSGLDENRS